MAAGDIHMRIHNSSAFSGALSLKRPPMKIAQYFFGTLCALSFTGLAFTSVLVEHGVVGLLVLHLFYMGSLVSAVALFVVLLAASESRYR
jgi:hypothetical protein